MYLENVLRGTITKKNDVSDIIAAVKKYQQISNK